MKKLRLLFLFVFALILSASTNTFAEDKVIIPDYEFIVNGSSIYYSDSVYPLLSYRDVTYFPLTYDYCRALSLSQSFVPGDGLYIAHTPAERMALPIYEAVHNSKEYDAVIPDYSVYLNGKKFNNGEYPALNFRGVTYLPLTYDCATDELGLSIDFIPGRLTLTSSRSLGRISVIETADDCALLSYYVYETGDSHYRSLGRESGLLSAPHDYGASDGKATRHAELTVNYDTSEVYFYGTLLAEVTLFPEHDKSGFSENPLTVSGCIHEINGVELLEISETVWGWRDDGSFLGQKKHHLYALDNNVPIFVGSNLSPENAAISDGVAYFTVRPYAQAIFRHYYGSTILYRLSDGTLTDINGTFPDHNNVILLGEANGKLYLKCEWAPNDSLTAFHEISPANDGYFTYDGVTLDKISPYIYTDDDIFFPDGSIYGIIDRTLSVVKIY